ncbi:MAG: hypothetical protein HEEMFOPI_00662 [Holosporales bacterium]
MYSSFRIDKMTVIHNFFSMAFVLLLLCTYLNSQDVSIRRMAFADEVDLVVCETGEVLRIDPKHKNYKAALYDSGIAYVEDDKGDIRSFDVSPDGHLQRTKIYRIPGLSLFYNLFHHNHYTLKTPTKDGIRHWAISRTMYDENPNNVTISVFELSCPYPVLIRNRDPRIHPSHEVYHKGPLNFYGVHITAIGKWVAISGYDQCFNKAVAYKRLNFDLAGYNFMMNYETYSIDWKPNKLYGAIGKKIGISQAPITINGSDWIIKRLPNYAQPNIVLKKVQDRTILCVPLDEREDYKTLFYDIETFLPKNSLFLFLKDRKVAWPTCPLIRQYNFLSDQSHFKKATLNGIPGYYQSLSKEPIDGFFSSHDNRHDMYVYKIMAGPIDFLTNSYTYVDGGREKVDLVLLE